MPPPPTKPPMSKPVMPPMPKAPAAPHRATKTFAVTPWSNAGQGKKVLVYGPSGIGKTSLAALAPNPIFLGLDDGGREITLPGGGHLNAVGGIESFYDLRDVLHQANLFAEGSSIVLDTMTKAEVFGEKYTFDTVKGPNNSTVSSIEDYGFGKGYRFLTETMRLLLTDFEPLVRRGVNLILLTQQGQAVVANLEGVDYLQDGPKLYHNKNGTGVRSEVCEWCDHVLRIGHPSPSVVKASTQATKGKASGSTDRAIYTAPELYYVAKSRPIDGKRLPPVVSFASESDDSLWQMVFHGAIPEAT